MKVVKGQNFEVKETGSKGLAYVEGERAKEDDSKLNDLCFQINDFCNQKNLSPDQIISVFPNLHGIRRMSMLYWE